MTTSAPEDQTQLVEQRVDANVLLKLVQTVHDDVKTMHTNMSELDAKLTKHMTDETTELATEISKMMTAAFPGGDLQGHRKHHEAIIARIEARAEFWRKMTYEIAKFGLIGLLGWLVVVVWTAFVRGVPK